MGSHAPARTTETIVQDTKNDRCQRRRQEADLGADTQPAEQRHGQEDGRQHERLSDDVHLRCRKTLSGLKSESSRVTPR